MKIEGDMKVSDLTSWLERQIRHLVAFRTSTSDIEVYQWPEQRPRPSSVKTLRRHGIHRITRDVSGKKYFSPTAGVWNEVRGTSDKLEAFFEMIPKLTL